MRLLARALPFNDGRPYVFLTCHDESDELINGVFETLVQFVEMAVVGDELERQLRDLVIRAERGLYVSPDPKLADFGINDVNLWLDQPMTPKGFITITNENTTSDSDSSKLQRFTYQQFWSALDFMFEVRKFVKQHGAASLLERSLECILPSGHA